MKANWDINEKESTRYFIIHVAKSKGTDCRTLPITLSLGFLYAKNWFSHDTVHIHQVIHDNHACSLALVLPNKK